MRQRGWGDVATVQREERDDWSWFGSLGRFAREREIVRDKRRRK
jgi:hypothetical protein